jgi:hypothetical protein
MAGERDWDKELAKIDKQLAAMSDDALVQREVPPAKTEREPAPAKIEKREPAPAKIEKREPAPVKIEKPELAPARSENREPAPARSENREAASPNPVAKAWAAANVPAERPAKAWLTYLRVLLAVALAAGMVFWPYEVRCGFGLAGYLGAVGVVIAGGIWSSVWTWRHRASRAHALSLLVILWGLVLASMEVLPRTGYAKPDPLHPASWACK